MRLFFQKIQIILGLLIPVGFLLGFRHKLIKPSCTTIGACVKNNIPWVDQIVLPSVTDVQSDQLSFYSQDFACLLGIFACLICSQKPFFLKKAFDQFLTFILAISINAFFLELCHTLTPRARPLIYLSELGVDLQPSHYTSFFSGHTSFTAAVGLFSILLSAHRHFALRAFFFITAEMLLFLTALFRITAGRHFLTDILAGCLFGWLSCILAFAIDKRLKKRLPI
jgi:membrane-associated phospholipid phosphatase